MSVVMADVIGMKLATLKELKNDYDTEDLWELWEAGTINDFNRGG